MERHGHHEAWVHPSLTAGLRSQDRNYFSVSAEEQIEE